MLVLSPPWQQVGLLLHQQLTDLPLLSQLLARAVTGHAAADAELHQSGVMVGPARAAASEFQAHQQQRKKMALGQTCSSFTRLVSGCGACQQLLAADPDPVAIRAKAHQLHPPQ